MMIGVFDSGFGGLTIMSALLRELPEYDYIYLGDSARAPYGGHSKEMVLQYTREGVQNLFKRGAKIVILACNTASALALKELQKEFNSKDRNILGVVAPIAESVAAGGHERVAIIGTKGTTSSGAYDLEIKKNTEGCLIKNKACPLLVPLIEEGWSHKMETRRVLKSYLREIKNWHPDVLVPACTHYPILQKEMQRIMGRKVEVLDTGTIVAKSLKDYLARHDEYELTRSGKREFLCTDCPEHFKKWGSKFLEEKIDAVEQLI